jgi:preprotein translocase subunit SecF
MQVGFVKHRRIWFAFSGILIVASIVALVLFGLKLNIDFVGGSLLEVRFAETVPANADIIKTLADAGLSGTTVQPSEEGKVLIRSNSLTEEEHQKALESLKTSFGDVSEERFDSIGPVIGQELRRSAMIGVVVTLILIGLYIAWAFRKVSEPIASWKYGLLTVVTGFHDVIVPLGVFAVLGRFYGWEIGSAFIAAILTILGYSISDTVVVFDRTRENLQHHSGEPFEDTVEKSIEQTYVRSINTSVTTLLALIAIFLLGGETTQPFALALIIGIAVGTYSSIFIASPALVEWEKWRSRKLSS